MVRQVGAVAARKPMCHCGRKADLKPVPWDVDECFFGVFCCLVWVANTSLKIPSGAKLDGSTGYLFLLVLIFGAKQQLEIWKLEACV